MLNFDRTIVKHGSQNIQGPWLIQQLVLPYKP